MQAKNYMLQALELAALGRASVSPNPMVGCLIVQDQQIVGRGYHQRAGEAHAEIIALQEAGSKAEGATVYVTLEPCCHFGRTPPCTTALINAKVKKIIVATLDPNPKVSGLGIKMLQAAGIEIELYVEKEKACLLNEIFFYYIQRQLPFVIAKWAMSLDGCSKTNHQDHKKISSDASHQQVHQLRSHVDAILVGANTAVDDNPQLNVRLPKVSKQPLRIVVTANSKLPLDLQVFTTTELQPTLIVTSEQNYTHYSTLKQPQLKIITLPCIQQGQIDLRALLAYLGEQQITSVLVEGGKHMHTSFFNQGLVNKVEVYVAPLIIANLTQKQKLARVSMQPSGVDMFFQGYLER